MYWHCVQAPVSLSFEAKKLTQKLMLRTCEDVETKNSCWSRKQVTIYKSAKEQNHQTHSFLNDTDKGVSYMLKLFYRKQTPTGWKLLPTQHINPRQVVTRRLRMLALNYLMTNQSAELHELTTPRSLIHHWETPRCPSAPHLLHPLLWGHSVWRVFTHCGPLCLAKE